MSEVNTIINDVRELHSTRQNIDNANKNKLKYNTTSTIFAQQSITHPDITKLLYSISCLLQYELFEDVQKIESSKEDQNQSIQLKEEEDDDDEEEEQQPQSSPDGELSYDHHHHHHNYSELELHTTLAAKFGGPLNPDCIDEDVLVNETKDDMELREYILMGQVPLIDTIFRFLECLQAFAGYSYECNIIALVYIKRMRENMNISLQMNSWRGLWVGSIIVAQKIWDDQPLKTSSFKKLLPNISKHDLNQLERKILQLLAYSTSVKPSIYARIYFELNEIYNILSMCNNNSSNNNNNSRDQNYNQQNVRPLSIVRARLLHIAKDRSPRQLQLINPSYHATPFSSSSSSSLFIAPSSDKRGITPSGSPKSLCISSHSSPSLCPNMSIGCHDDGMKSFGSSSSTCTIQLMRSAMSMSTSTSTTSRSHSTMSMMTNKRVYDRSVSTLEDVTRTDSSFFVLS